METDDALWEWVHLLPEEKRNELLALENAKREIEWGIINDHLREISGRPDFCVKDLTRGEDSPDDSEDPAKRHYQVHVPVPSPHSADGQIVQQAEGRKNVVTDLDLYTLVKLLPKPGFMNTNSSIVSPELRWMTFCCQRWLMASDIMVTLFSLGLYVGETYAPCCPPSLAIIVMEWVVFGLFSACAVMKFFIFYSYYLFSYQGFIDIFVSLPPTPIYLKLGIPLGFLRWLRLVTSFMMRYESNVPFVETGGAFSVELSRDNFIKRTWGIFLLFFGGIFTMAGTMLAISVAKPSNFDVFYDSQDVMHLHTSMFFCMTSLLTVNHGDIIPSTTVSRSLWILSIIAVYILLGYLSVMYAADVKKNWVNWKWGKRYQTGKVSDRHIVICGDIEFKNLAAVLQDIYHGCYGALSNLMRVAVLCNKVPDTDVQNLLSLACYYKRVQYLIGRPVDYVDLDRAGAQNAHCILVLVNNSVADKQAEDIEAMMTALSVLTHQHVQYDTNEQRLLVGVNLPNSEMHLRYCGCRNVTSNDALKLNILAQCCRCPGWAALVSNLICSRVMNIPANLLKGDSWLAEYCTGAVKKFYCMPFSPFFRNYFFSDVAKFCYEHFELILAAVESTDENGMTRVLVNPGPGYYIRCDDCAFVLAESFSDARNIKEFAGLAFTDDETGRMAELIGRVTFNNKAINSGEDFVNYVKTSATLASCRRVHQVGHTPDEELGIAVLEAFGQKSDPSMSVWKKLSNLGLASGLGCDENDQKAIDNVSIGTDTTVHTSSADNNSNGGNNDTITTAQEEKNEEEKQDKTKKELYAFTSGSAEHTIYSPPFTLQLETVIDDEPTSKESNDSDNSIASEEKDEEEKKHSHTKPTNIPHPDHPEKCILLTSAEDLVGHVLVMGFIPHISYLTCFLNEYFCGMVAKPLVFMSRDVQKLRDVILRYIAINNNTACVQHQIFLLQGDPIKYQDLKKAGISTADTVIVLHLSSDSHDRGMFDHKTLNEMGLLDSHTLFSFLKMSGGLLRDETNIIVEFCDVKTLAFMHSDLSLKRTRAFRDLPVETCAFMWPKYAAGKVINANRMVNTLLSSSIYKPTLVEFIQQLVRHDIVYYKRLPEDGLSGMTEMRNLFDYNTISPVQQICIPSSMVGYSFGDLYQQLVASPLHIVTLGLYRARGTRGSPEPFVYTGCRADTVINSGDKAL